MGSVGWVVCPVPLPRPGRGSSVPRGRQLPVRQGSAGQEAWAYQTAWEELQLPGSPCGALGKAPALSELPLPRLLLPWGLRGSQEIMLCRHFSGTWGIEGVQDGEAGAVTAAR